MIWSKKEKMSDGAIKVVNIIKFLKELNAKVKLEMPSWHHAYQDITSRASKSHHVRNSDFADK